MSGGGYRCKDPVKIVIINTQYVETDATSFKSVVQKLTGKDSNMAATSAGNLAYNNNSESKSAIEVTAGGNAFLTRDMSFKEFDRLLREMPLPPINEFWSD